MKFHAISLLVLSVLLSSPTNAQGFGPQKLITETVNTNGPQGVYAADLDGDGDLDVLSASQFDKKLAFYLNEGGGQFGAQQLVTDEPFEFNKVVAADLDLDGDVDVVACAHLTPTITWYSNNGDGSFDRDGDNIQEGGWPRSVTLADLNADGYPDVLAVLDNSLCWYENRLGTSSADFGVKQDIRVDLNAPSLLRAADLDGDGDLDVLSASLIDREISWYENLGGGASWTHWEIEGDLDAPTCIYAEDMDGDGDTDVIYNLTTTVGTPLLAWYENVGTGSAGGLFDADSPHTISTTDVNGACNVLGEDLDGDGDADVILAQQGGNNERISWYANDGLGGFGARQEITTSVEYVHSMCTADLDGDGDVDLLSASPLDDKVAWYENLPFVPCATLSDSGQTFAWENTWFVTLGDVDGDGDLDLVCGNLDGHGTTIYLNDGNGGFSDSGQELGGGGTSIDTKSVSLGDLDGDGDLDLVVGNFNAPNPVYWNDGSGNFSDSGQALQQQNTNCVALGDLDDDNDLDLVLGNWNQPSRIYFNDGNGIFSDSLQGLGTSKTIEVALGDLDGDGDLDFVEGNNSEANRVFFNDGTGIFSDSLQGLGTSETIDVALGDLDGDGDLDLVEGNYPNEANRVFFNDGTGYFSDSGQSLGANDTRSVDLGDLDGDGDLDLVAGNGFINSNTTPNIVYLNDGSGVFSDSGQELGSSATYSVALGDLDVDGDLDLFAGNRAQMHRVYLNECAPDCNSNGFKDSMDIAYGGSSDCDGDEVPDECQALGTPYCIASSNSVSAIGAQITAIGVPNLSGDCGKVLRADNLRPNQFGVFFYGPIVQDPPVSFGDGYRCVGVFGLKRLNPPESTGTGTTQRVLDMTVPPLSSIQAGDTRYFQFWYRDPNVLGGVGYNLTDGLEITFGP